MLEAETQDSDSQLGAFPFFWHLLQNGILETNFLHVLFPQQ